MQFRFIAQNGEINFSTHTVGDGVMGCILKKVEEKILLFNLILFRTQPSFKSHFALSKTDLNVVTKRRIVPPSSLYTFDDIIQ